MTSTTTAPKILLTGSSGYVGSHILDVLLNQGYDVRITARTKEKAESAITRNPQFKAQIDYVIVPDFTAPTAYDNALEGITAIIHTASPLANATPSGDFEKDLLIPAIQGTTTIIKAALHAKSIKRVVITSSVAAVLDPSLPPASKVYTENDWNPITYDEATKGPAIKGYYGSKKFAEKAVWDFVKQEKPHFDVVTILPPFVFGPYPYTIEKESDVTGTLKTLFNILEDDAPFGLDSYVDARDVAQAHVLALEKPIASNQRYILAAGSFSFQEVADIAHKHFPGKTRAKIGTPGVYPAVIIHIDSTKVQRQLGLVYRSKEETFKDSFAQLVEVRAKTSQ